MKLNPEDPKMQGIIAFAGFIAIIALYSLVKSMGIVESTPKFYWLSAASFMLLFSVGNSVMSLTDHVSNNYWGISIFVYVSLAVLSGLIAYLASNLSVYEAGSYKFIYFVITFGYLVFISIMGFMKKIVAFAQKEVWNQPKIRRR